MTITVIINDKKHNFENATTVSSLLHLLELDANKIALERNLEIVPRSTYNNTTLNDGDRIEIVHFIGGG